MAQWSRALVELVGDLSSVPSTHTEWWFTTLVLGDPASSSGLCEYCMHTVHKHACRQSTHIHGIKRNLKKKV